MADDARSRSRPCSARDLNRCIELGGNIYFLAKIGATDGKSFQQMAGSMTGMTRGGVPRHDDRRRPLGEGNRVSAKTATRSRIEQSGQTALSVARITASVYTSHVPAIGAALDLGKTASRTGSRCSRATSLQGNGSASTRRT